MLRILTETEHRVVLRALDEGFALAEENEDYQTCYKLAQALEIVRDAPKRVAEEVIR